MCGRFIQLSMQGLTSDYPDLELADILPPRPRYNITPGTKVTALVHPAGHPKLASLHWGLVPRWAKEDSASVFLANARSETLTTKPAFRHLVERGRCLIPCQGFYEWRRDDNGRTKTPYFIHHGRGEMLYLAGLWDSWSQLGGAVLHSCTIITCPPNQLMQGIHHRMPVLLPVLHGRMWLDERYPSRQVLPFMQPFPDGMLAAHPVSQRVNSPQNDDDGLIVPITPPASLFDL
jgi:putative SOS response-associated peptidase YedK